MTEQDWRARTAWRNAVVCVVLNIVGMPIELAIVRTIPEVPVWPALASMAIGALLLGVLFLRKRTPTAALGNAVFLINVAVILSALWVIDLGFAASGRAWVPFQEYKLGMMTVALLAPEAWVGVVSIGAYAIAAFIQLATFSPTIVAQLALGEPWATLAFTVFAAVLLAYRIKRTLLERDIAIAHTKIDGTVHLARVLLAVRDLANTPLQTIAFACEAARARHPDIGPAMDRVERSLASLRELDRRLRAHDDVVPWNQGEESLDAMAIATGAMRKPREHH